MSDWNILRNLGDFGILIIKKFNRRVGIWILKLWKKWFSYLLEDSCEWDINISMYIK